MDLVGKGRLAYVWIGNNAVDDKACFATVDISHLREFAKAILRELPAKKKAAKKR